MSAKAPHQPISVSPATVEFVVVRQKHHIAVPVVTVAMQVTYDGLLHAPQPHLQADSLLCFHVRTSHPQYIRVKGGWGQYLLCGETTTVEVGLRGAYKTALVDGNWRHITKKALRAGDNAGGSAGTVSGRQQDSEDVSHMRLWITSEIIRRDENDESGGADFQAAVNAWKEQRAIRQATGACGNGAQPSPVTLPCDSPMVDGSTKRKKSQQSLWRGRNFDMLHTSYSKVVPCMVHFVHSEATAEIDILREKLLVRRAVLREKQQEFDCLMNCQARALKVLRHPSRALRDAPGRDEEPQQAPPVSSPELAADKKLLSVRQRIAKFSEEMEWMEVVGLILVLSSTALLGLSL